MLQVSSYRSYRLLTSIPWDTSICRSSPPSKPGDQDATTTAASPSSPIAPATNLSLAKKALSSGDINIAAQEIEQAAAAEQGGGGGEGKGEGGGEEKKKLVGRVKVIRRAITFANLTKAAVKAESEQPPS